MQELRLAVRVYLEDTDAQGVVYNASYFRFMERARTEWLQARGVDHNDLRERFGLIVVLTSIEANFQAPARLGDVLDVKAEVVSTTGARLVFAQSVRRTGGDDSPMDDALLCVTGTAVCACIDAVSGKPRRWPKDFLQELTQ
jgi:acyl-CoA thioester hydrolase